MLPPMVSTKYVKRRQVVGKSSCFMLFWIFDKAEVVEIVCSFAVRARNSVKTLCLNSLNSV